jgi:flagellar biosynthesis GTPase FlhF
MQQQFNPAFQISEQQTFDSKFERVEGLYQISPFGVVLQPVVSNVRPTIPMTLPESPIISTPTSPELPSTPQQNQNMKQEQVITQQQHPLTILSPLSVGGFLYTPPPYPSLPLPPNAQFPSPAFLNAPLLTPNTKSAYVSSDIAARQEKLEKYREKRAKRNYNRPVDQGKRERACARSRDQNGQFTSENKREQEKMRQALEALEASNKESELLKSKLSSVERELEQLRRRAEEERLAKQHMLRQLEAQQKMNQDLLHENTLLWSTVPVDQVFNTINPTNPPVFLDAFKQKIDFSSIELNYTDSPHLEAARTEDMDFEQRWDDMTFFTGAQS